MRRISSSVLGLSIAMVFAGLASTALAQTTVPVKESAHEELIKTLRHAHHLLMAHADKDYDGHRAKAAEEVHKALKDLESHHKKPKPSSTPAGGVVVPPKAAHAGSAKVLEPQGDSDAQLKVALGLLQGAATHFSSKHPHAHEHVDHAIAEITTALAIK